jgi:hypothetical protein
VIRSSQYPKPAAKMAKFYVFRSFGNDRHENSSVKVFYRQLEPDGPIRLHAVSIPLNILFHRLHFDLSDEQKSLRNSRDHRSATESGLSLEPRDRETTSHHPSSISQPGASKSLYDAYSFGRCTKAPSLQDTISIPGQALSDAMGCSHVASNADAIYPAKAWKIVEANLRLLKPLLHSFETALLVGFDIASPEATCSNAEDQTFFTGI